MPFDPKLANVVCGTAPRMTDERGVLTRMAADGRSCIPGFAASPRQILHSGTAKRGTLRGLHGQSAPYTEAKLLCCLTGRMFWVVVDLRAASATFGRWRGYDLSPDGMNALYAPAGFGHGCLSLTDDVNLMIMADKDFSPDHGIGIAWDDPDLAIDWPLAGDAPLISKAHAAFASFADFRSCHGGF